MVLSDYSTNPMSFPSHSIGLFRNSDEREGFLEKARSIKIKNIVIQRANRKGEKSTQIKHCFDVRN